MGSRASSTVTMPSSAVLQAGIVGAILALYWMSVSSVWAPFVVYLTQVECDARALVECKDSVDNHTQHHLFVEAQGEVSCTTTLS
jgi:hypothetical protein